MMRAILVILSIRTTLRVGVAVFLSVALAAEFSIAQTDTPVPSMPEWGSHRFVEYIAGELPVVIAVPHDGDLTPDILPDRTFGVSARDNGTQEITRRMITEFVQRTGKSPHVVFLHLRRKKLDVNREEFEAAQGDETALRAWTEYHAFIDSACDRIRRSGSPVLFIDMHGQKHPEGRIEIGYRLESDDLALSDAELNGPVMVEKSSLQWLTARGPMTHAELVRGPKSFGAMFDRLGIRSTPSPSDPSPESHRFYSGGYTLYRHAVEDPDGIVGVQFELNPELRQPQQSASTAKAITGAVLEFMTVHLGFRTTKEEVQ